MQYFKHFSGFEFSYSNAESIPVVPPLKQTVGAPSEAWRFLQGESPC